MRSALQRASGSTHTYTHIVQSSNQLSLIIYTAAISFYQQPPRVCQLVCHSSLRNRRHNFAFIYRQLWNE